MKSGLNVLTVTGAGSSKDSILPNLQQANPKYLAFLKGLVSGNIPPTFSEKRWENVSRRFGLSVHQAQAYANDFLMKRGAYE